MKAITLRNIPPELQKAIREKARRKRISANRAVLELLQERVGGTGGTRKTVHTDLDDLAGSWTTAEAKAFEKALRLQRRVDDDLWR